MQEDRDPLVLAGDAAAILEDHGFVACGKRQDGITKVEFWSKTGDTFHYTVTGGEGSPAEVAAACLSVAIGGTLPARHRPRPISS